MSKPFDLSGVIVHQDTFDPHDNRPWIPFPDGVALSNKSLGRAMSFS